MIVFGVIELAMLCTWIFSAAPVVPLSLVSPLPISAYVFSVCLAAMVLVYAWMFFLTKNKTLADHARYFLAITLAVQGVAISFRWQYAIELINLVMVAFAFWVTSVRYHWVKGDPGKLRLR
jgi:hypothetical protein